MKNIILSADDTTTIPMCVVQAVCQQDSAGEECGGDCFVSAPDIIYSIVIILQWTKNVMIVSKNVRICERYNNICRDRARCGGMIHSICHSCWEEEEIQYKNRKNDKQPAW